MSFSDFTNDNISDNIEQCKFKLNKCDEVTAKLHEVLDDLTYTISQHSNEFRNKVSQMNNYFTEEITSLEDIDSFTNDSETLGYKVNVDLGRFAGVLDMTDKKLLELKTERDLFNDEKITKLKELTLDINSDCGSEESETLSQHSEISSDKSSIIRFFYKRKVTASKVICIACHDEIATDSYLIGDSPSYTVHISKNCVQADRPEPIDFSRVRCFVYKLLRSHDELKQLLSCGFYYTKITGFKPQNTVVKGFSSDQSKMEQFVYRRKDPTKKPTIICVTCHKPIHQPTYLTKGNSLSESFHLKKKCIPCEDFSKVQCWVFKLLRRHEDLKNVLACGFYYSNIIGVRPQNPDFKAEQIKPHVVGSVVASPQVTNIDYIFNNEPFICEQLLQNERCQGCRQTLKKGDIILRHKERIPREKLKETPLISQFYHPTDSCLESRGFTNKYLETATCFVVLPDVENRQRIRDLLVRSGLASNNLRYGSQCQSNSPCHSPSPDGKGNIKTLFVVICAKINNGNCQGCGFNIAVNDPCLVYGESSLQNDSAKLFHIQKGCLRAHFPKSDLEKMTCINNNSLADVSREAIEACGIVNIITRSQYRGNNFREKGDRISGKYNPFKLNNSQKFIVDVAMDNRVLCAGCKKELDMDKYVLRMEDGGEEPLVVNMHLEVDCVRRCGYLPQQLASCHLQFVVYVSRVAIVRLQDCGFRDIPANRDDGN